MSVRSEQAIAIRAFLESIEWDGHVLDYGCDIAPYREIVGVKGALWVGYNRVRYPSGHKREDVGDDDPLEQQWDWILMTQVLQYVPYPDELLRGFAKASPRLAMTYALGWPEVEKEDLWRFTRSGMEHLLMRTGWIIDRHERLGSVHFEAGEEIALGYGVVCHRGGGAL